MLGHMTVIMIKIFLAIWFVSIPLHIIAVESYFLKAKWLPCDTLPIFSNSRSIWLRHGPDGGRVDGVGVDRVPLLVSDGSRDICDGVNLKILGSLRIKAKNKIEASAHRIIRAQQLDR